MDRRAEEAGQADRAVHYLELAADRAARIFANDEAIGLYRQALGVIDGDGKAVGTGKRVVVHAQIATALAVCEKLAALLMLIDRFAEARAVALDGIARAPAEGTLEVARLQHLLAHIEWQDLRRGEATAAIEALRKVEAIASVRLIQLGKL